MLLEIVALIDQLAPYADPGFLCCVFLHSSCNRRRVPRGTVEVALPPAALLVMLVLLLVGLAEVLALAVLGLTF